MTDDRNAGQADWPALRARYEAGSEKVKDIAAAAGVSAGVLVRQAKALGWKLRTSAQTAIAKAKPPPEAARKAESTRETLKRLKDLLQERVTQLEGEVRELGLEVDALNSERKLKSVNLVVRTLEKVLDLERKDKLKRKQHAREFKFYNDEQRLALAQRIARLRGDADRVAAEPAAADQGRGGGEPSVAVLGEAPPAAAAGDR